MVALYRPGPMAHIPQLHRRARTAASQSTYPHPSLEHVLRRDLRRHRLPGPGAAGRAGDRRLHPRPGRHPAPGDGQEDRRGDEARARQLPGGREKNDVDPDIAAKIWDYIEPFAGYAFNKSPCRRHGAGGPEGRAATAWPTSRGDLAAQRGRPRPADGQPRCRGFRTGEQPTVRLTTAGGRSVICTLNHKFLTPDGFRPLAEIGVGGCAGGRRGRHPMPGRVVRKDRARPRALDRAGRAAGRARRCPTARRRPAGTLLARLRPALATDRRYRRQHRAARRTGDLQLDHDRAVPQLPARQRAGVRELARRLLRTLLAYQTAYLKANHPGRVHGRWSSQQRRRLGQGGHGGRRLPGAWPSPCCRCRAAQPEALHRRDRRRGRRAGSRGGGIRFGLRRSRTSAKAPWTPSWPSARPGAFRSLDDFCRRVDLEGAEQARLESLIKARGAGQLRARERCSPPSTPLAGAQATAARRGARAGIDVRPVRRRRRRRGGAAGEYAAGGWAECRGASGWRGRRRRSASSSPITPSRRRRAGCAAASRRRRPVSARTPPASVSLLPACSAACAASSPSARIRCLSRQLEDLHGFHRAGRLPAHLRAHGRPLAGRQRGNRRRQGRPEAAGGDERASARSSVERRVLDAAAPGSEPPPEAEDEAAFFRSARAAGLGREQRGRARRAPRTRASAGFRARGFSRPATQRQSPWRPPPTSRRPRARPALRRGHVRRRSSAGAARLAAGAARAAAAPALRAGWRRGRRSSSACARCTACSRAGPIASSWSWCTARCSTVWSCPSRT